MKQSNVKMMMGLLLGLTLLGSCKKSADETPVSGTAAQLSAQTWQVEKVTEVHTGTPATVIYQRGASSNQEDFSLVRQRFNSNGSLAYTDETGFSGTDAHWELLDNNTRLKITFGGYGVTFEQFVMGTNQFSYKTPFATATDYVLYTFTPAP